MFRIYSDSERFLLASIDALRFNRQAIVTRGSSQEMSDRIRMNTAFDLQQLSLLSVMMKITLIIGDC